MDPDMVTRLRGIANGSLSPKHRVTRVTDPPPAAPHEDLAASTDRKLGFVTRATRATHGETVMAHNSSDIGSCQERVTSRSELKRLDPIVADELEERAAVAQHEGGFPAEFALAFAHLQVNTPGDVDEEVWQRAVDAMGRVLDQCRERAQMQFMARY
jgi:hypothetical protein